MDFNTDEIAKRGAEVFGDANFTIIQCNKCGAQFLYEKDTMTLYPDPQNLSNNLTLGSPPPPCPQCYDADWEFSECDESAIEFGDWGWAVS